MGLAQGDGQRCGHDVDIRVGLFGALVGDAQHLRIGHRIHRLLAPLGIDVWFVPDLDVLHAPLKVLDKSVDEITEILQVGRGGLRARIGQARPFWGAIQAGDHLQAMGTVEVHNLVELGPTALPTDRLDKLALLLWFDLGPGELLLCPSNPGFLGHFDRSLTLPELYLTGQEKVGAVGIDVRVWDRAGRDPLVPQSLSHYGMAEQDRAQDPCQQNKDRDQDQSPDAQRQLPSLPVLIFCPARTEASIIPSLCSATRRTCVSEIMDAIFYAALNRPTCEPQATPAALGLSRMPTSTLAACCDWEYTRKLTGMQRARAVPP